MRISVSVGEYAKTPYYVPGIERSVYCMEELCYCIREDAFLLDLTFLNDGLLDWIERECEILPEHCILLCTSRGRLVPLQ